MKHRMPAIFASIGLSLGILGTAWAYAPISKTPTKTSTSPSSKFTKVDPLSPVADSPKPTPMLPKGFTGTVSGALGGIETDAKGEIIRLVVRHGMFGQKTVAGCGAKIQDLPHIPWAHMWTSAGSSHAMLYLDINVSKGCLSTVGVRRHAWTD